MISCSERFPGTHMEDSLKPLVVSIALVASALLPASAFAQSGAPAAPPPAAPVTPAAPSTSAAPPAPADAAAPAAAVTVPGGTPVKVMLTEQVASNSAHAGDKIHFKAVEDVTVDGWVVVSHDAIGEGSVVSAESAGGNGHPGKIQLQFDWIYGTDGLKIKLSDVATNANGDAAKGAASTAAIASYLVLGPLGLFAHNWVHGKDVVVKTDQKIPIYVAQTVHVTPKVKVSSTDGFAH
jgi:hypothetical protein